MRIVRYRAEGRVGLGILEGGEIASSAIGGAGAAGSLDELLAAGPDALQSAAAAMKRGPRIAAESVEFLPPVAKPGRIICVGLNYLDHTRESGFEQPEYPTFFARYASSLIGHGAPIVKPRVSDQLDYEGEIVAVIGKPGRRIPRRKALEHVCGYSIFNDVSVRDFQFKTTQWTMGKNFDDSGPMGPAFVPAAELPPGIDGLRITTLLNGVVVQDASTSDLIFKIDELVSIASGVFAIAPGDLIVSGTPAGVGFARNPPLFMKAGDTCDVGVEGIGILSNPVVNE